MGQYSQVDALRHIAWGLIAVTTLLGARQAMGGDSASISQGTASAPAAAASPTIATSEPCPEGICPACYCGYCCCGHGCCGDCGCGHCCCGHQGCLARYMSAISGFNCSCRGSYKFPVPPQYTYHWPGMYSQQSMTEYRSPYRYPPLKLPPWMKRPNGDSGSPEIVPLPLTPSPGAQKPEQAADGQSG